MPSPRCSFPAGLLWKIPLALMLIAGAMFSFVWYVLLDVSRAQRIFGEQRGSLLHEYVRARALRIPAYDSDHNGIADWAEERLGFVTIGARVGSELSNDFVVYQGERTSICARSRLFGIVAAWPIGFRARVSATKPVLFLPGSAGPAGSGPLELDVSPSGTIDFDVLIPDGDPGVVVEMVNAANGISLGETPQSFPVPYWFPSSIVLCAGKRLPPVQCHFMRYVGVDDRVRVAFESVTGVSGYVVEAAPQSQLDAWMPIAIFSEWKGDDDRTAPYWFGADHRLDEYVGDNLDTKTSRNSSFDLPPSFRGSFRVVPVMRTDLEQ